METQHAVRRCRQWLVRSVWCFEGQSHLYHTTIRLEERVSSEKSVCEWRLLDLQQVCRPWEVFLPNPLVLVLVEMPLFSHFEEKEARKTESPQAPSW